MQLRYRFGKSLLNDVRGLAVIGEELFVCDMLNHRLQVFSLAGEHRRSITGGWKWPSSLCAIKDRLYLVERSAGASPWSKLQARGQRIFVLSLQGETLQVYPFPTHNTWSSVGMLNVYCPTMVNWLEIWDRLRTHDLRLFNFDGKLLVASINPEFHHRVRHGLGNGLYTVALA